MNIYNNQFGFKDWDYNNNSKRDLKGWNQNVYYMSEIKYRSEQ